MRYFGGVVWGFHRHSCEGFFGGISQTGVVVGTQDEQPDCEGDISRSER